MRIFRRPLDVGLLTLFFVSASLILIAHEDPFAREWVCAKVPCPKVPHESAWLKIIYDFSVASVVSLLFYGLVVRLPDYQRRQRLKRSFASRYQRFKEDCISVMLGVVDGGYSAGQPETWQIRSSSRTIFRKRVL